MKLDYLTPLTKINLKWIEDLNIRPETVKLLEENVGKKLTDSDFGSDFLDMTPEAQTTISAATSNYEASAQQKKQSKKWKCNLWNGENIC